MRVREAVLAVTSTTVIALSGACGDDSDGGGPSTGGSAGGDGSAGIRPVILAETLVRDGFAQSGETFVVKGCKEGEEVAYECVLRDEGANTQTLLSVDLDDRGGYRATTTTGFLITGRYPQDTAYRGLDLAALMREVVAQGKEAGQVPPGAELAEPACEVDGSKDRAYDCYLEDPRGESTRSVTVQADGAFHVPDVDGVVGDVAFSGRLPESFVDGGP